MIDPRVALVLALAAGILYGGKAVIKPVAHGVKVAAVDVAKVVSHPFRHPVKDSKAVGHAVTHPKLLTK